ncbi:MAG: PAS domain S-box protein [Sphingobacteriales bacterium]
MKQDPHFTINDDQFGPAADRLPILVWACNKDNSYCFFNSAWLAFTGRSASQAGDAWAETVNPEDEHYGLDKFGNLIKDRKAFNRLYRLKRHDGVYRWIAEQCQPGYEANGDFAGYTGYGVDVGELLEDPRLESNVSGVQSAQRETNLNEELAATNEELSAANEELSAANEELVATNEELRQTQDSLAGLNSELEGIVAVRTKALVESQQATSSLNEELAAANEEMAATNEELAATNEELAATNEELEVTIEELAESREDILKSEKLFKSIALNIPKSLIIVIGKDHRFIAVEGDLVAKLGYNSKEYIGKHPAEVAPPERYEANKHLYDRVFAGEQFSIDRKGENGEDYRMAFVPLKDDANEVYAALIIALDITDIRQAEEKSAKLAAIVASSDDAIISKTLDGIVTSWNASAERMFGFTEKEMIGQPILKIIPEDRYNEEPRILEQLRKGHRVDHFETIRRTKDGKMMDISLTISPVRDSEGNIIGASKIARDISDKKRDEQRKNDFISMVSHELKTPLTSLTAIVQLLQAKLGSSSESNITAQLKNANKQVKRMAGMINGFLNVSRLETGKMPMAKTEFVLNDLVKETVEEMLLTGGDNTFHYSGDEPMTVNADSEKITSVVLNLLSNATKYSAKGSAINVECRIVDGKAQVSVRDDGIGIKPADLKKLFERYYRVESDATRHIGGFGIGLYLSAEIIREHHGEIWVESKPGKGSVFYFTLPLS